MTGREANAWEKKMVSPEKALVILRLFCFAPFSAARSINAAFLSQNCQSRLKSVSTEVFLPYRPLYGGDPVLVKSMPGRELVGMSAVFNHKRPVNQVDRVAGAYPKPEVIILACREGLVNPAQFLQKGLSEHD